VDEKEEDLSALGIVVNKWSWHCVEWLGDVDLGEMIRQKLIRTRLSVLHVTGCDDLSSGYKLLQRSMKVRYPYVDPLNVLQVNQHYEYSLDLVLIDYEYDDCPKKCIKSILCFVVSFRL